MVIENAPVSAIDMMASIPVMNLAKTWRKRFHKANPLHTNLSPASSMWKSWGRYPSTRKSQNSSHLE